MASPCCGSILEPTFRRDQGAQPRRCPHYLYAFLAFKRGDPIPNIADGDPGAPGDLFVRDITSGVLGQILDRLKDHPLGTKEIRHRLDLTRNASKQSARSSARHSSPRKSLPSPFVLSPYRVRRPEHAECGVWRTTYSAPPSLSARPIQGVVQDVGPRFKSKKITPVPFRLVTISP
jgi:hypothetical protein